MLYKLQYGFWEKMSTEMAVSEVCNDNITNIENEQITCSIFLDLQKAFGTVNHYMLLLKLQAYGVRGFPLQFLQSYLTNRSQCTILNYIYSSSSAMFCGIPQGSTLGPLLFLMYINDSPLI